MHTKTTGGEHPLALPSYKRNPFIKALEDAVYALKDAMGQLDAAEEKCSCCSMKKKRNWAEAQAHRQLTSALAKTKAILADVMAGGAA